MKSIEEIEKLSIEELEQAAQGTPVPEGLAERLQSALAAETIMQEKGQPPVVFAVLAKRRLGKKSAGRLLQIGTVSSLAIAAAIAAVVLLHTPSMPKDTFDDPLLAYAQVEETFQYISSKMSGGVNIVREAGPVAGKPKEIIRKINEK